MLRTEARCVTICKDNSDLQSIGVISLTYTADADLSAMHAAGFIFLIIFGFFVENHLLVNTKSSFYDLQFESYNLCRQQALFFS